MNEVAAAGRPGVLAKVIRALAEQGPAALVGRIRRSAAYHWRDKWEFHYLEFSLDARLATFPQKEPLTVRVATADDVVRLEAEIFSRPDGPDGYDRTYLPLIGTANVRCYLAERAGTIVHYSWVFLDAATSPLSEVPFDPARIRAGDVYVGPVYTDSSARGFIYLYVLGRIVEDLRQAGVATRVIVLVAGGREAAVNFYKKMGFREIVNATRGDIFRALRQPRSAG